MGSCLASILFQPPFNSKCPMFPVGRTFLMFRAYASLRFSATRICPPIIKQIPCQQLGFVEKHPVTELV
jgi:hypothetical protein